VALAVSLGWLLFVVTHRLASGRFWPWAVVDLVPPLLFLAVPLLLLAVVPFARPIRWPIVAVIVLAGVLGAGNSGVNYASLWYNAPPAPSHAITVVSWNTEYWDQDWRHGGQGFDPEFYRYLRDLDADVYLLQEYIFLKPVFPLELSNVRAIDRVDRLQRELPGFHVAVAGSQITISRYPIVAHHGLDAGPWLPESLRELPEDLSEFPDFDVETLRTDVLVNGEVVTFYNSHIIQPHDDVRIYSSETRHATWEAFHRRVASFQVLQADVDDNPHPVVVGGDLNGSPATGMLRLLPDRLVDRTPAINSLYPSTWEVGGRNPELWKLGWLFTTPDVTVHEFTLVDPAELSDHRALRAQLSNDPDRE
jgi:endonuclease/exonuclease/phosphatase family metal-dependent hydrolase